jgi:hypothetical protein
MAEPFIGVLQFKYKEGIMSTTGKILIFIGMILTLGAMGFIIYNQINISKQQTAIQNQVIQQKTLIDGLVQSANTYTTKADLDNFISQNTNSLKAIQDNLAALGASLTAANVVTANSQGQVATNVASTSTTPSGTKPATTVTVACPSGGSVSCPTSDPFGYLSNLQTLALNENFATLQVPVGSVSFSAWQANPWSVNLLPRQYNVTSVIGTDENQRVYVDNQFTVKTNNKTYTIPITTAQTQQVYPTAKLSWWNPEVFGGADVGLSLNKFPSINGEFAPSVNFGFVTYGKYKTSPDWSFGQVGASYGVVSKRVMVDVTPVAYNLHTVLPFLHNTYVGPSLHVSTDGSIYGAVGLRVGF